MTNYTVRLLVDTRFKKSFLKWFSQWALPLTIKEEKLSTDEYTGYTGSIPVSHIAMFKHVASKVVGVEMVAVNQIEE